MDYGKLAYLRLDELENDIAAKKTARIKSAAFSAYPDFPLRENNSYLLGEMAGDGRLTILIKLTAEVEAAGRAAVFIDGKAAGFADYPVGTNERIVMLCVRPGGKAALTVCAQNGFSGYLTAFTVAVIGENASVTGKTAAFAADDSGSFSALLINRNEQLTLCRALSGQSAFAPAETVIGAGGAADLCGCRAGGFYAVYTDHYDNFWLTYYGENATEKRMRLGNGVLSCAVFDTGSRVAVAYVRDGRARMLSADYGLTSVSEETTVESNTAIDRVAFVKQASVTTLLLTAGGNIFLRASAPEYRTSDTFQTRVQATLQS